jgi:hypothetical protein
VTTDDDNSYGTDAIVAALHEMKAWAGYALLGVRGITDYDREAVSILVSEIGEVLDEIADKVDGDE